jgi:phosphoglycolate phosphatase-like HAD superfamily hydrolase
VRTKANHLVLFDIDGTLIRGAGPHHKQALVEGIRRVTGRATTLDTIETAGALDRDLIASMLRASGESERRIRMRLTRIMLECQNSYLSNCASDLTPFLCRGVADTLAGFKSRGAILGLVTGNLSAIGWRKVELAGVRSYFSLGAFAEDGRTRARLARVAAARAARLGFITKSSRVFLIGDHINDIAAAKANGYWSIAVASGVTSFEELAAAQPDTLVRHLGELELSSLLEACYSSR